MTPLQQRLTGARDRFLQNWEATHRATVERRLKRRLARRRMARRLVPAAALMTTVAMALLLRRPPSMPRHASAPASGLAATTGEAPGLVRFGDRATAHLRDAASEVSAEQSPAGGWQIRLRAGGARFRVIHDPSHPFVVLAGELRIEDLGTDFMVEHLERGVRVAVYEGRVRAISHEQSVQLGAGDAWLFPAADVAPALPTQRSLNDAPTPLVRRSTWRKLALAGKYDQAYPALLDEEPSLSLTRDEDLLLAANAARLSGHARQAEMLLRRALAHRGDGAQATVVAFTLGRLLLEQLERPAEAAEIFERVVRMDPRGQLGEHALAREVEAWVAVGDTTRAHEAAQRYLRQFPHGAHIDLLAADAN